MNRLKEIMAYRGMTCVELGYRVGRHRKAIMSYRSGEAFPFVHVALRIARELGVTVEDIWGDAATGGMR